MFSWAVLPPAPVDDAPAPDAATAAADSRAARLAPFACGVLGQGVGAGSGAAPDARRTKAGAAAMATPVVPLAPQPVATYARARAHWAEGAREMLYSALLWC